MSRSVKKSLFGVHTHGQASTTAPLINIKPSMRVCPSNPDVYSVSQKKSPPTVF